MNDFFDPEQSRDGMPEVPASDLPEIEPDLCDLAPEAAGEGEGEGAAPDPEPEAPSRCACEKSRREELCYAADEVRASRPIVFCDCADFVSFDAGDLCFDALGRMLELCFTLKQVCHDRAVAIGIALYETDGRGKEYPRGFRSLLYPGFHAACKQQSCRDVKIRGVRFVLPEAASECGSPASLCKDRTFVAKFTVHYASTDVK